MHWIALDAATFLNLARFDKIVFTHDHRGQLGALLYQPACSGAVYHFDGAQAEALLRAVDHQATGDFVPPAGTTTEETTP